MQGSPDIQVCLRLVMHYWNVHLVGFSFYRPHFIGYKGQRFQAEHAPIQRPGSSACLQPVHHIPLHRGDVKTGVTEHYHRRALDAIGPSSPTMRALPYIAQSLELILRYVSLLPQKRGDDSSIAYLLRPTTTTRHAGGNIIFFVHEAMTTEQVNR